MTGEAEVMRTGPVVVAVLALVVCVAAVLVAAVRISRKAKPLGNLPYRWGLYLGISYGVGGVIYFCLALAGFGIGAASEGVRLLILTMLAEIAAVGTCRRRRWGVVVLIATQAVTGVLPPLLAAIDEIPNALNQAANGQHVTQKALVQALGGMCCNFESGDGFRPGRNSAACLRQADRTAGR